MDWPVMYGPAVVSVLTIDTSAEVERTEVELSGFEFTPPTVAVAVLVTKAAVMSPATMV